MRTFIKILVCAGMILLCKPALAQTGTIYLSTAQAEDLFLRHNLELIAERLEIDLAEAEIMQARLWPNPTLMIEEAEVFSSTPRMSDRQFAIGIEQVITTGGKRRKLVEMEHVTREIAAQHFEDLLRSLKVELRNACAEMLFLQEFRKVLERQQASLDALIANYRNQVAQGNVSRSELFRLQAELLDIRAEINELQREMNEQQRELKILLNIPTLALIVLTPTDTGTISPEELSHGSLFDLAEASRPDLKEAMLQREFFERSLRYERAQRIPDLAISAMFDRAGGVKDDYVGFGVSMDLPVFDRNQGNIRAAQVSIRQSQALIEHKRLEVRSEVSHAMQNYTLAYNFNRQIADDFLSEIDGMLESYIRNFTNRNIGIVEFLDFFEAYKESRRTILEAQKDVKISFEELQYAVGTEIQ
jgi:cobalt-zinc-cadmium efflux system outer membrane protein